jgi:tRNA A-37 threonylcarbamoyl transferase component Bud32
MPLPHSYCNVFRRNPKGDGRVAYVSAPASDMIATPPPPARRAPAVPQGRSVGWRMSAPASDMIATPPATEEVAAEEVAAAEVAAAEVAAAEVAAAEVAAAEAVAVVELAAEEVSADEVAAAEAVTVAELPAVEKVEAEQVAAEAAAAAAVAAAPEAAEAAELEPAFKRNDLVWATFKGFQGQWPARVTYRYDRSNVSRQKYEVLVPGYQRMNVAEEDLIELDIKSLVDGDYLSRRPKKSQSQMRKFDAARELIVANPMTGQEDDELSPDEDEAAAAAEEAAEAAEAAEEAAEAAVVEEEGEEEGEEEKEAEEGGKEEEEAAEESAAAAEAAAKGRKGRSSAGELLELPTLPPPRGRAKKSASVCSFLSDPALREVIIEGAGSFEGAGPSQPQADPSQPPPARPVADGSSLETAMEIDNSPLKPDPPLEGQENAKSKGKRPMAALAQAPAKAARATVPLDLSAAPALAPVRGLRTRPEEALSKKFSEKNVLDFDDAVPDGFYDPGRARVETLKWRSRQAYKQMPEDGGDREVLVVEAQAPSLQKFLKQAKETMDRVSLERSKYKMLALLCSDALGGPDVTEAVVDRMIKARKKELSTNEIPLHVFIEEQLGYCRQRALLYKLAIDHVRTHPEHRLLSCRLIRGQVDGDGHAWNAVQLGEKTFVCDVFQRPGELLHEGSDDVRAYHTDAQLQPPESRTLVVPSNYFIEWGELHVGRVVGSGGFATVHAGTWRGFKVAVKCVNMKGDTLQRSAMANRALEELKLLASLQRFSGVIGLLGGSCSPENSFIVMPFMERLTMRNCLDDKASTKANLYKALINPLEALGHLHTLPHAFGGPVIHYDIKPENIGVTYDWCGKLMDVGASKVLHTTATTASHLTADYSAPEVRRLEGSSTPADVFSYGLMICEVQTRRPPRMDDVMKQGLEAGLGIDRSWPIAPLLLGKRVRENMMNEGALAAAPSDRCTATELHVLFKEHWCEMVS